MIILGIDPGTAQTGWGIIKKLKILRPSDLYFRTSSKGRDQRLKGIEYVAHGSIKTSPDEVLPQRLLKLRKELRVIIREYRPEVLVMEQLFFNTNSKSVVAVGRAMGVVILTAGEFKIPVYEYTPLQAKLELTGYGRAEKSEIQSVLCEYLNLSEPPRPVHAADALAVAICYVSKSNKQKD